MDCYAEDPEGLFLKLRVTAVHVHVTLIYM